MADKRSVGLVMITEIPEMGRVAVLQRRGEFNHEKMGPESWPGGCQVTAHGKVEENETFERALFREIVEELGENLKHALMALRSSDDMPMREVMRSEKGRHEKVTLAVKVPMDFLGYIRLGPSSGGLVLLPETRLDEIKWLTDFGKDVGVTDRRIIAMFPDEIEAVRRAFEVLK
ncbi:MAG: NUDIX domain-containing protein [bacterium]|nr:NUDIX domain-containing protein [bacterium]